MHTPQPGFDPVAADYDRQFSHTAVGRLQRAVVHRYLTPTLYPGMHVLELNCGTGEDALWLARQGCLVQATDLSPEMVRLTAEKAQKASLQHRIQTAVLDIRALTPAEKRYELILSNFGGLNCLSPEALRDFGKTVVDLLQPGAWFVAVVMSRFCWWETAYFLAKGKFPDARRRWSGGPVSASLGNSINIETWYYSSAAFEQYFPGLQQQTLQPVGIWLPPSYLNPLFSGRPGVLHFLNRLEQKCRGRLWARAADHFLIAFRKPGY